MIKQFTTEKGEFIAVKVPDDAEDLCMPDIYINPTLQWNIWSNGVATGIGSVDLLDGKYELLGESTELTEEQCAEIVSFEYDNLLFDCIGELFKNYLNHSDPVFDSVQSFASLMQ